MRDKTSSTWHEQVHLAQLNPLHLGRWGLRLYQSTSCLHPSSTQQGRFLQLLSPFWRAAGEHKGAAVLFIQPLPSPSLQSSWCAGFQQTAGQLGEWRPARLLQPAAICQWRLWLVLVTQWPSAVWRSSGSSSSLESVTSRDQMCCNQQWLTHQMGCGCIRSQEFFYFLVIYICPCWMLFFSLFHWQSLEVAPPSETSCTAAVSGVNCVH